MAIVIKSQKYNVDSMSTVQPPLDPSKLSSGIWLEWWLASGETGLGEYYWDAPSIDIDGDSLEAEAFGYLAVRSILGKSYTFKNTTGVSKNASGGVLFYYKG